MDLPKETKPTGKDALKFLSRMSDVFLQANCERILQDLEKEGFQIRKPTEAEPDMKDRIVKIYRDSKSSCRITSLVSTHKNQQDIFTRDYNETFLECLCLFSTPGLNEQGGWGNDQRPRGGAGAGVLGARREGVATKLTSQTLQAMSPMHIAELVTVRAQSCSQCVEAVQGIDFDATNHKNWTYSNLRAKLETLPHFSDKKNYCHIENMGRIIRALLQMKAEANSAGKEYSKMLETFKFFLQHDSGLGGRGSSFSFEVSSTYAI
jgi:hypothetical protein